MENTTHAFDNGDGTFTFVEPNQPFVLNGIQYPLNWTQVASADEISDIGLLPVVRAEPLNIREVFIEYQGVEYIRVGDVVVERHVYTDRPIKDVVSDLTEEVSRRAGELLGGTDWYVIRFIETGTPIPPEVALQRSALRARASEVVAELSVATADNVRNINTAIG